MITKSYIVVNKAGANMRLNPSTSFPTTALEHKDYLNTLTVICDWTATNTVGSNTKYLPIKSGNNVIYCVADLLAPKATATAVLALASAEMGAKSGAKYTSYFNSVTDKNVDKDEAWCTQFAWWCCRRAGMTTAKVPNAHIAKDMANGFSNLGKFHKSKHRGGNYTPKPGDFGWTSSNGEKATHTFLVRKVSGNTLYTYEGNRGGVAKTDTRKLTDSNLWGFGEVSY